MKRFVSICSKVKYLGLLGLPSLFLDHRIFDLLWLLWLLGFVEIFYYYYLYVQSFKQLWGMLVIPLRYGANLPNIENYISKVTYSLPFHGSWTVVNGGIDKTSSHSWSIPTQRYAYDFLIIDDMGKSHVGADLNPNDYYCYGKEVLAPADGEVIEAVCNYPDSHITADGKVGCIAHDIRGNHLLLRHAEGEYSLLAHLKPDSIRVKIGDRVQRGQCIALCGNSGNSSEPHLHFQIQNGVSFFTSAGLPVEFDQISVEPTPHYSSFDPRPIPSSEYLPKRYIIRGQTVCNRIAPLSSEAAMG